MQFIHKNTRINIVAPFAKEQKGDIVIKCILFLISPFLSFFYSLRTMDRKSSYICFFLFAVFWCLIQCPDTDEPVMDIAKNRIFFEKLALDHDVSLAELIIMSDMGKALYTFSFLYVISLFTDNYHWFILISGCLVSFFQLKCFRFFTSSTSFVNGWKAIILACMFAMHAPLYWAGAVRWILAGWITVYGTLQIWMNKDYRYWFLLIIPPLIHYSFFVYLVIFVFAFFTGKNERLWTILLLFSFAFQFLATSLYDIMLQYQDMLPKFLIGNMGSVDFMEEEEERIAGLNVVPRIILTYIYPLFPTVLVYFFYFNKKNIQQKSESIYSLFQLTIVLTFFFNVLSVLPDLGRRLGWILYVYYAIVMVNCFLKNKYIWIYMLYLFSASALLYGDIRSNWLSLTDFVDWITNPISLLTKYIINPIL